MKTKKKTLAEKIGQDGLRLFDAGVPEKDLLKARSMCKKFGEEQGKALAKLLFVLVVVKQAVTEEPAEKLLAEYTGENSLLLNLTKLYKSKPRAANRHQLLLVLVNAFTADKDCFAKIMAHRPKARNGAAAAVRTLGIAA